MIVESAWRRRRLDLRVMLIALIVLGATLIVLAIANHLYEFRASFWSELLLHLGTGFLVGAFFLILDKRFTEALQRVQDALSSRVERTLVDRASFERTRATEFADTGNYRPLRELLIAAQDLGSISRLGVRIPVATTTLYLRVALGYVDATQSATEPGSTPEPNAIDLVLETSDRRPIVHHSWNGDDKPATVILALHDQLAQTGYTIPRSRFVDAAAATRQALADTLLAAVLSRGGDDSDLKPIGRIFQKAAGDWFITSHGLENVRTGALVSVDEIRRGPSVMPDGADLDAHAWELAVAAARDAWRADEWAVPFW